jgi:hypothetical protein
MNHSKNVLIHWPQLMEDASKGGVVVNVTNCSIETVAEAIVIYG